MADATLTIPQAASPAMRERVRFEHRRAARL